LFLFTVSAYLLLFLFSILTLKFLFVNWTLFVDLRMFAALTSDIDQKVHIKVKAKSQPESKNVANSFELDNGHATKVQPIDSTGDQSLCCFLSKCCYQSGVI